MSITSHHTISRFVAVLMAIVLLCCTVPCAMAKTDYDIVCLNLVSNLTASRLTEDSGTRAICAALILTDYGFGAFYNWGDSIDVTRSIKIACYGSSVDVYFPVKVGGYLNLCYSPSLKKITDYGFGGSPSSSQYYYYTVTMNDFIGALSALDSLFNNK